MATSSPLNYSLLIGALLLPVLSGCSTAPDSAAPPAASTLSGDSAAVAAPPSSDGSSALTVVFTSNIDGEIEPCG